MANKPSKTVDKEVKESNIVIQLDTPVQEPELKDEKVPDVIVDIVPIEKKVKIRTNATFKKYIGDKWYYFNKGDVVQVPVNVRDLLLTQGVLDVLI